MSVDTTAGLPRPLVKYPPENGTSLFRTCEVPNRMPVPWINGNNPVTGQWLVFDINRCKVAHPMRNCTVCGSRMKGTVVYLNLAQRDGRWTSGPGAHPKCALIAANYCPHVLEQWKDDDNAVIAYAYDGEGQGYIVTPTRYGGNEIYTDGEMKLRDKDVRDLALADLKKLAKVG